MSSELARALEAATGGDRAALARLLTRAERGDPELRRLIWRRGGEAHTIGLTGPPGAGKSTLTSALVRVLRRRGASVAVVAVDPSSPFSGGAILGDRVRMSDHDLDDGVFVRSMATRGHLGGLSAAVPESLRLLEAVRFDRILVETVGVGQVELEVAETADTTVVVLNPGWGDAVQAAKAGLLEIADIFVLNKSDRPGTDTARHDLERVMALSPTSHGWTPPVIATVATTGAGVDELAGALDDHRKWLDDEGRGEARRSQRAAGELDAAVEAIVLARARERIDPDQRARVQAEVAAGRADPWTAAEGLVDGVG